MLRGKFIQLWDRDKEVFCVSRTVLPLHLYLPHATKLSIRLKLSQPPEERPGGAEQDGD
jgi:hypothetical protein